MVFMGTSVANGSGKMLVVAKGRDTVLGQIAHLLGNRPSTTEFERGIQRLGSVIGFDIGMTVMAYFSSTELMKHLFYSHRKDLVER